MEPAIAGRHPVTDLAVARSGGPPLALGSGWMARRHSAVRRAQRRRPARRSQTPLKLLWWMAAKSAARLQGEPEQAALPSLWRPHRKRQEREKPFRCRERCLRSPEAARRRPLACLHRRPELPESLRRGPAPSEPRRTFPSPEAQSRCQSRRRSGQREVEPTVTLAEERPPWWTEPALAARLPEGSGQRRASSPCSPSCLPRWRGFRIGPPGHFRHRQLAGPHRELERPGGLRPASVPSERPILPPRPARPCSRSRRRSRPRGEEPASTTPAERPL